MHAIVKVTWITVYVCALTSDLVGCILASFWGHFDDFGQDHLHLGVVVLLAHFIVLVHFHESIIHLKKREKYIFFLWWKIELICAPFVCENLIGDKGLHIIWLIKANSHDIEIFWKLIQGYPEWGSSIIWLPIIVVLFNRFCFFKDFSLATFDAGH